MVRAIVSLMLLTQVSQAATTGLALRWNGQKTPRCQKLVEAFLTELRSMATDHVIELEAVEMSKSAATDTKRPVDIECEENAVRVTEKDHSLLLRYSQKASGFDAMDWLPFQQRYLRDGAGTASEPFHEPASLAALAPQPTSVPPSNGVNSMAEKIPTTRSEKSIFQRWWFWGIVAGAVGGGIYAVTQSASRESSVNVEIQ